MSDPVLSQLVTVEHDLTQQVESLESKLAAIQEQKEGLRTVIEMFQNHNLAVDKRVISQLKEAVEEGGSSIGQSTDPLVGQLIDQPASSKRTGKVGATKVDATKVDARGTSTTTAKKVGRSAGRKASQASPQSAARQKSATAVATSQKSQASNTETAQKKKDGRAADWQKYVQTGYEEAALPEAVSSVLRSQPSKIFAIADIMSSIFTEDMPRDDYLKARNRISNILSAGARDGTWYRGRNGRYSQSESVTKSK